MDFFIQSAYAQGAPQQGDPFGFLLPMLIIFGAFYFLLIRPQQKKQKAHTELISNLKSGDEILTAGGILGVITGISEHYAIVRIADKTEIKIQKSSVAQVVPKDTFDNA
jgi:preprotein translocase subunit YajC